jgi:two-component system, LytTR family, response regulator
MYKAIIIDDERHARNEVKRFLQGQSKFELYESATYEAAIIDINNIKPDLIFLDIQLNGHKTGFDVLQQLDWTPHVIFITAFDTFAIQAFEKSAIDYLLKPIDAPRFNEALRKALDLLEVKFNMPTNKLSMHEKVFLKMGDNCWFVMLSDIIYFETCSNFTKVFFDTHSPIIFKSINQIEARLDLKFFFRTSRTQIVNLSKIDKIIPYGNSTFKLLLINNQNIFLSRRQSVKFRELMSF